MSKKRNQQKKVREVAAGQRLQALHLIGLAVKSGAKNDALPKKLRKELRGLVPTLDKAERKASKKHRKLGKGGVATAIPSKRKRGGAQAAGSAAAASAKAVSGRRARKRARR